MPFIHHYSNHSYICVYQDYLEGLLKYKLLDPAKCF